LPSIKKTPANAYLLPNYDEYIVGYKDRTALIDEQHFKKSVNRDNLLFSNIIVVDGYVVGNWKRTIKKKEIIVETTLFKPLTKSQNAAIATAIKTYKKFIGN
jgi:hypothetical protein